jgi:hypothetical protein
LAIGFLPLEEPIYADRLTDRVFFAIGGNPNYPVGALPDNLQIDEAGLEIAGAGG